MNGREKNAMKRLSYLTKTYNYFRSYFPTKLPVGTTEFEAWVDSIIELAGKYADRDSMKFAIASMLIHADARHGALSKQYFVTRLRKSAANQIASQVFQDLKQKQAEATVTQKASDVKEA